VLPCWARTWGLVHCRAGLGGRLDLNSFIQTRQMYTYEIPMGNRVQIIASQTHTRLPNGWRFCPISIPMGTIFVPYPYPNRGIPYGLAGIGSPLTSLDTISPRPSPASGKGSRPRRIHVSPEGPLKQRTHLQLARGLVFAKKQPWPDRHTNRPYRRSI
jgi:hypothetical protein